MHDEKDIEMQAKRGGTCCQESRHEIWSGVAYERESQSEHAHDVIKEEVG